MVEITIHGRGGQGGVTLAKLIATAYFRRGKFVQAFGVYAAERSGAPLQAYVRIDDEEISNHNQIRNPDHLIVLDRTLINPTIQAGLKPGGWVMLNTPDEPEAHAAQFPGRKVATVDATRIAVDNGLGTRAVPIVNSTIFGAVARALGLSLEDVDQALAEVKFGGSNLVSAREAFAAVVMKELKGEVSVAAEPKTVSRVAHFLDGDVGGMPRIRTGTWTNRQPQRHELTPPCNQGCPAGNDVQGFIAEAAKKNYDEALRILLETSPFPGVCGRVCPAPCMDACNRRLFDEAVNIRELERYAADHGTRAKAVKPWREEPIAIVGSGPAGLSAAYHLARLGYSVTAYESGTEFGGVLRTGIPTYRLPRDVLDGEINYILNHGVKVITSRRVDRGELLRLSNDFAAVFIATGLQEERALDLGTATGVVWKGLEFLDAARQRQVTVPHEHVVVIGGGNTALDAARTARRLGAKSVRIVYRRTRAEMPAIPEEIAEALEEGVVIDELVSPLRLRVDGVGPLLTCQRMRLGEPDASGRRAPIPEETEDAQFDIRCHRVILALGQSSDMSILPSGSELKDGKVLLGLTTSPIFTCGDFASHDGTVTAAIGSGRRAAWHVHRTLSGEDLFPQHVSPVATAEVIHMPLFTHGKQRTGAALPASMRKYSFEEVHVGLRDAAIDHAATAEAQRCFSCGVCNHCDRCVTHCPEGIMVRDGSGYRFDEGYCKGCGVCAAECPRGVIYMTEL